MLKVQLEDVSLNDLLCGEWTLSEKASVLITKLGDLGVTNSSKYFSCNISAEILQEIQKDEYLIHPILKCLCLINKFQSNVALVDSFISLLFKELGFYSDYSQ